MDRLAEITLAATDAIRQSGLPDADKVTISNVGSDFLNSRSPAAGGVIIYPFPKVAYRGPKMQRITWTLGILANARSVQAAARCSDILDVLTAAGVISWRAEPATVDPTDFAVSEDPAAPKVPGWAVTITEEHLP